MSADDGATYVTGRHFRGARLPYAGSTLAMTVALPTGPDAAALRELLGAGLVGDGEPGLRLRCHAGPIASRPISRIR